MNLTHYSYEPLLLADLFDRQEHNFLKPRGLWLSVDGEDDWEEWCRGENFRLSTWRWRQTVILRPDANVLLLDNEPAVRRFTKTYHSNLGMPWTRSHYVDWPNIMQVYDGLIIAPYQWSLRFDLEMMWYYGWDCASGCLWNPTKTVASVGEPVSIKWEKEKEKSDGE